MGTLTPKVFAQTCGHILLHGVESNNLAAVLEASAARFNSTAQNLRMNKQDSSANCIVGSGKEYSNSNPASVYIQFVNAHLKREEIVRMMNTHECILKAERRARAPRAQAAKLREEEGEEAPADEQEAMSEVLKRRKEVNKQNASAAGSAPKKKPRKDIIPSHNRFKPGVAYPSWPTGSTCDVSPEQPRVKWEVKQMYAHLADVFGADEAAVKMDHLTAPTTKAYFLIKMKNEWDSGFPSYSGKQTAAIRAALITF